MIPFRSLLFLCPLVSSAEGVLSLTKDAFDGFIKDNRQALVKFYAPWCGFCKQMAPEYEAAAEELKHKVVFADIDATVETELAEQFGVSGYPTLKFWSDGNWEDYNGGRTMSEIVDWLTLMTGDPYEVHDSYDAAVEAAKGQKFAIIVQAAPDSAFLEAAIAAASRNRTLGKWILVHSPDEFVTAIREADGQTIKEVGLTSEQDVIDFVKRNKIPYFGPINGETFPDYSETGLEFMWFIGDKPAYAAAQEQMLAAGRALNGKLNVVWLDREDYKVHAENMLNAFKNSQVVVTLGDHRFVYDKPQITSDDVVRFAESALRGDAKRDLKSEPVPETNSDAVKVVVGSQFEEMVFRKDKDVFLEVHAPWCGHCKKFDPDYTKFAETDGANSHVILAKLDGTANEIPVENFQYKHFPTIYFIKAGSTVPMVYDGARSYEGLKEFYNEHSTEWSDQKEEL
ncbi:MAG: hypothetical protein KVP17_000498 [Porospora cf. gigantea B]|uniref:uncharacterized protein n=1 Tax=Porospora cf. gigantea B TaxID=2853592 RepID=UPI003571C0E2|nr:MAG: hypothetical protein KVP17_000498 [Porospora cf. gigantea B]